MRTGIGSLQTQRPQWEPLAAQGCHDLLDVVDHVAVEVGGRGREGLLGEGLGGLTASHHGVVEWEGVLLLPLQETCVLEARQPARWSAAPSPCPGPI